MRILKTRRGFTLIEIVVSIGILAVSSMFIMEMYVRTSNIESKARDVDNAVTQMQTVIEYYKLYGTLDPASSGGEWEPVVYGTLNPEFFDNLPTPADWRPERITVRGPCAFAALLYYDGEWAPADEPEYYIRVDAPPPDENGVQTIELKAYRVGAYPLTGVQAEPIASITAYKYMGVTE